MDIKDLRATTGLSQAKFGEWLNIPVRTLQDWESGRRTPPPYVVELIEYRIKGGSRMLKERVLRMIDEKVKNEGIMGTEQATVKLNLTDEEKEDFYNIEWNDHYWFEFAGNEVYVTYQEEI